MLSGPEIKNLINNGLIKVLPFVQDNLNANSLDVRLAPTIYEITTSLLDFKTNPKYSKHTITDEGFIIRPDTLYLGVTVEYTSTPLHVPIMDGRSTCGRYGLNVHQTAGLGDVGFAGHWTMEITSVLPVRIYPKMRIAQLSFHAPDGKLSTYKGGYDAAYSENPVPGLPRPNNF